MALNWLMGLYGPARDIVGALVGRRPPRLKRAIEATHLGSNTWVRVTAWCEGNKPIVVRGCFAELYVHAYDACTEAYPVRTRAIKFAPSGIVRIAPDSGPVYWEAQVANGKIRRISCELDAEETLNVYGKRGPEVQELRLKKEQLAWANREKFLWRLVRVLSGPESVSIRAVIETMDGRSIETASVAVPPAPPRAERVSEAVGVVRQAIRTRSKVSQAAPSVEMERHI